MRFKELKKFISCVDRISICLEDGSYENYFSVRDISDIYDDLYVFGIGVIESEFPPFENWSGKGPAWQCAENSPVEFLHCLEIVLHKKQRFS